MRVIVCGGREYGKERAQRMAIVSELAQLPRDAVLVHGAARGADRMAARIWDNWRLATEPHPADWKMHGRAAGPIRNQEMLDAGADLVIAFPGGKGTADMVQRARRAGIPVRDLATSGLPERGDEEK